MKSRNSHNKANLLRARKRLRNSLREDESFVRYRGELPDSWGRPSLRSKQSGKSGRPAEARFSIDVPLAPGSVVRPGDVLKDITIRLPEELDEKTVVVQLLSDDVLVSRSTLPVSAGHEARAHVVIERHDDSAKDFTMVVCVGEYIDSVGWVFAPVSEPSNRK